MYTGMTSRMAQWLSTAVPESNMKRDRRKKSFTYLLTFYLKSYFVTIDRAEILLLVCSTVISWMFRQTIASICLIVILSVSAGFAPQYDVRFARVIVAVGVIQATLYILMLALRCICILLGCVIAIPFVKVAFNQSRLTCSKHLPKSMRYARLHQISRRNQVKLLGPLQASADTISPTSSTNESKGLVDLKR